MAEERDFNDILDDIVLSEEREHKASYEEGFKAGKEAGNPEGYHLGYHRGVEIGQELGYYLGMVTHHINLSEQSDSKYSDKLLTQLSKVKELIDNFPRMNSEDHDILAMVETGSRFDDSGPPMKSTIGRLRSHINSITKYLTPLLPLANCHMVEFLTDNHWENLLPSPLRKSLDGLEFGDAVDTFWMTASDPGNKEDCELGRWVHTARSLCVTDNNDYCLSTEQLKDRIRAWGGEIFPEIRVKEFMTSKKSYEVETMSSLVASLHQATSCTCSVEVGGGRGHLPAALSLGFNVPSLTIDCDETTVNAAALRVKVIQKQWHAIAKRVKDGIEERVTAGISGNLHRFSSGFVTRTTDLTAVVKQRFPEYTDQDIKLLLTGLHTCGNLGPDSLRIFTAQPATAALLTVPCCYHLLSEDLQADAAFDVFQRQYGSGEAAERGFPMSEHLRGYQLGRNARMLAAQSIDRVLNQRQMPSKSLLYRALLQSIIKNHLPDHKISEGKLKRITPKCQNFEQYFKMADAILKLELFDSLPASFFIDIGRNADCQWKKLVLFYLLRLCLAQVIETLILLDRVLFMFENGYDNVYLVKLFDPVLSPRCHGIVAVR